ncbi:hypothetical protein COCVIDRAFT_105305 [Bipolaris victoriae FI3]|uniref:Uncharacterized protein n=1 Tax=Bipolaris victoriae (strain FI3) TaxID=930091 RepID=W7E2V8_BIPV3|nr:hypothetical protein COCVIDRAFT_105305 [Bipolaris victoriae FI3]
MVFQTFALPLKIPILPFLGPILSFIYVTCLHLAESAGSTTALIPPSESLTGDGDTITSGHDVGQVSK